MVSGIGNISLSVLTDIMILDKYYFEYRLLQNIQWCTIITNKKYYSTFSWGFDV